MRQKKFNSISTGCSGKFGDQVVFKIWEGATFVSACPKKRPGPGTPNQARARRNFQDASEYATLVLGNSDMRQLYTKAAKGRKTARCMAMADYMKGPEINNVYLDDYKGEANDMIFIHARDNVKIKSLTVAIYNAKNELLEQGLAQPANKRETIWRFDPVVRTKGTRIMITAIDLPGNIMQEERFLGPMEIPVKQEKEKSAAAILSFIKKPRYIKHRKAKNSGKQLPFSSHKVQLSGISGHPDDGW